MDSPHSFCWSSTLIQQQSQFYASAQMPCEPEVNSKDWVRLIESISRTPALAITSGFFQASHQASLMAHTHNNQPTSSQLTQERRKDADDSELSYNDRKKRGERGRKEKREEEEKKKKKERNLFIVLYEIY